MPGSLTLDGLVPPLIVASVLVVLLVVRRTILKSSKADVVLILGLFLVAGGLEVAMGRPLKYRNGPVRLWSGDINSDQNSQQIADPYSFTHVTHGAAFYGLTHLVMPRAAVATRLLTAVGIEAAWEVYENTNTVVERYRTETISLGYYGDSVVNSVADIVACIIGFLLTWRLPRAATITWVVVVELMLLLWIRDNLTLNILMLVYPIDAVRQWQAGL
jgi:Protein of unknown function (DUF2585)